MDDAGRRSSDEVWARATADPERLPAVPTAGELVVRDPAPEGLSAVEAAFGSLAAVLSVLEQLAGPHASTARRTHEVVVGLAWQGYRTSTRVATTVGAVTAPAMRLVVDPPLVPRALRLRTLAERAADGWRAERPAALRAAASARDVVVPAAVDAALAPVNLTELVLSRVDLSAVVSAALDRLDLTEVVVDRVDLERVVDAALRPMDLTGIVVDRVELGRVVDAALSQLDLTAVVTEQVDLAALVNAALDRLDLTALVRERVDLAVLSQEVIDAVDLPEIIRESTGSVASETVRSVRMQSINADDSVQRIVDRVILWRKGRQTDAPGEPDAFESRDSSEPTP